MGVNGDDKNHVQKQDCLFKRKFPKKKPLHVRIPIRTFSDNEHVDSVAFSTSSMMDALAHAASESTPA